MMNAWRRTEVGIISLSIKADLFDGPSFLFASLEKVCPRVFCCGPTARCLLASAFRAALSRAARCLFISEWRSFSALETLGCCPDLDDDEKIFKQRTPFSVVECSSMPSETRMTCEEEGSELSSARRSMRGATNAATRRGRCPIKFGCAAFRSTTRTALLSNLLSRSRWRPSRKGGRGTCG